MTAVGGTKTTLSSQMLDRLEQRQFDGWTAFTKKLNWKLEDHAGPAIIGHLLEALRSNASASDLLATPATVTRASRPPVPADSLGENGSNRSSTAGETPALLATLRDSRAKPFMQHVFLWHKSKDDVKSEMDSELQMPGWGNVWTQPIINRVDMLATGVRTQIGIKVFGGHQEDTTEETMVNGVKTKVVEEKGIQTISNEIAALMNDIPGIDGRAFADQIGGRGYVQIDINREKAARYGVNVSDISDAIEIAMGGRTIMNTVEGRQRFPVRVRYARDFWQTQEALRQTLVTGSADGGGGTTAAGGMGDGNTAAGTGSSPKSGMIQIPLAAVADIQVVEGPSVIKSENGMLRSYVQLNVHDRDIVGFVEEAQRTVAAKVKLPPGFYIEWSGQFEHQIRARKTLTIIFPLVILLIFVILYVTFNDFRDALLIILTVPGALVGGVIFQSLFGFNFSVAVWVGYIACFGMATQTGIVMLVYLHDAINSRGGLAKIATEAELTGSIITGAVHRLRPKLMTEGVAIVGLMPMLWASGVGAEVIKPMAAPVLGGLLVADEVIDLLLPVIFNWYQVRQWRKIHAAAAIPTAAPDSPQP